MASILVLTSLTSYTNKLLITYGMFDRRTNLHKHEPGNTWPTNTDYPVWSKLRTGRKTGRKGHSLILTSLLANHFILVLVIPLSCVHPYTPGLCPRGTVKLDTQK